MHPAFLADMSWRCATYSSVEALCTATSRSWHVKLICK
uniref:Uncharacterized protein n=1 Tax=Ascaris lumbricoides TaxID=6252 RepID=A0A0M3HYI3_ASCLU